MLYKKLYKNISVVALGTALFSLPVFTACESDVETLNLLTNSPSLRHTGQKNVAS